MKPVDDAPLNTPKYLLALILMIVPLTGFVIDIYTPSLPAMADYFAVDKSWVQLTITVQIIAFGLFHTVFSTLSGRWGLRRVLVPGMLALTVVSFLVPFSPNIAVLLILRFLQGTFICIPSAIAKNLLSMHYEGHLLRRYANYMTITWALGPIIAPMIGGYLQHYFNWQASFLFLASYSLVCLVILYWFLPKQEKPMERLSRAQLINNYRTLLTSPVFLSGSVCLSLVYGLLLSFNVIGPFVVQSVLHYSAVQFGYIAMLMGAAWLLGTVINRLLTGPGKISVHRIVAAAMWVLIALALIMLILSFWMLNLFFVVAFTSMILLTGSLVYPNILGEVMSLFRHQANVANGLMGSLNLLAAGLTSIVAAAMHGQSALPLAIMFFGLSIATAAFYHGFLATAVKGNS